MSFAESTSGFDDSQKVSKLMNDAIERKSYGSRFGRREAAMDDESEDEAKSSLERLEEKKKMLEKLQAEVRKDISSLQTEIKRKRSSRSRGGTRNAKSFLQPARTATRSDYNYGRTLQDYRSA